ncbi:MAG: Hsp20 family protein [Allosphingosinicella sp.]|uniref:Hsp20 family protein n=1 Tax=Allosphingosinicella sp. TaxID=2823234 RepID=UPI00396057C2
MRNFDFTPFRRSTVGFDRLFDLLESGASAAPSENYPPFDLEQRGDDAYRITLAVAGFREEEIEITQHQNLLVVSGRKRDEENEGRFIHRGIATRAFERRFGLADFVRVKSAEMKDGLLAIELVREIPEEMKPRRVEIGARGDAQRIERDADNENGGREAA